MWFEHELCFKYLAEEIKLCVVGSEEFLEADKY